MRGLVSAALSAALLAAVLAVEASACSQCLCGTPFPSDALGGVVPMQFRYGFEERYLSKSNALDEAPGTEQEREHRVSAFGLWRPTNRLALLARVPYNAKEITESPVGAEAETHREHGIGDAEALALVGLIHGTGAHAPTLSGVLGVTAPTGSNDRRDVNGDRLDQHLQPGTGAWSGTAGLNIALAVSGGTFDASVLGRANGTSEAGYRYGNVALYNAGYTTSARRSLQLIAQLNGRSAKRDQVEDGTLDENTGGTVLYASPGIRWRSAIGVGIEGVVQFPIYESLYGVQDEHTTGRIALYLSQ
jgi:hypothetical protein